MTPNVYILQYETPRTKDNLLQSHHAIMSPKIIDKNS